MVAFIVTWFDHNASLARKYRLNHFSDNTIEMINIKNNQTFLTRSYFPDLKRSALFLGASLTINSRQLHIVEYADKGTGVTYESSAVRAFGLVKPEGMNSLGAILSSVPAPFTISRMKMVQLDTAGAARFGCSTGAALAFEAPVIGVRDGEEKWMSFVSSKSDMVAGACGVSEPCEDASFCFGGPSAGKRPDGECTACLIKPHAVKEMKVAAIVSDIIEQGFKVEALETIHFDMTTATSFFEVYKGVFSFYSDLMMQMVDAPCLFLKLSGGSEVVTEFREFCGPQDVEVAKVLRPKSLRARYGSSRVLNAIHCTDLPNDAGLECSYLEHLASI